MGVPWRNLPRFHEELVRAGYVTDGLTYPSYFALWRALASA
jgi:fatty acid desaturase